MRLFLIPFFILSNLVLRSSDYDWFYMHFAFIEAGGRFTVLTMISYSGLVTDSSGRANGESGHFKSILDKFS